MRLFQWYNTQLTRRPWTTQIVTTAVLFAAGDITAQQAVERRGLEKHDAKRTLRMFAYGGCIFGPVATAWFGVLGRIRIGGGAAASAASKSVGKQAAQEGALIPTTLVRVGLDQLLFAPISVPVFLSSMALMEGRSVKQRLEMAYWPALKANWMLWPAVQTVNFIFVPAPYRLVFVNVIAIGWNCVLSVINAGDMS